MLLKEMYQAMYGKIDTRIGRAFAPITEVDDEQMIKYKDNDGESKEMKASSAKTMPMDHPAKVEYDKLAGGDDGGEKKSVNIFDKPAEPKKDAKGREYDPKTGKGMGTDYRGGQGSDDEYFASMMGDTPKDDIGKPEAIGKNTPAKKAESPEVQRVSDYFFNINKKWEVNGSDAAQFAITHYKALTGYEYDFEEGAFDEDVIDFMETVVGDEDWQDDWNDAHEGQARSYDEGEFEDYSDDIPNEEPNEELDGEAIMPKGSFQEIKEQWVRDNIKVL